MMASLTHLLCCLTAIASLTGFAGENIALGKKYTMTPHPGYPVCTGPNDATKLTDGKIFKSRSPLWMEKDFCVGWEQQNKCPIITVDLGRVEPIGGVSFRSAFDAETNVRWPSHIDIFVSDDGNTFSHVGDLVDRTWANQFPSDLPPQTADPKIYQYRNDKLAVKGRYVAFVVDAFPCTYVFCDEVEVFKGPENLLNSKPAEGRLRLEKFIPKITFERRVKNILTRELDAIMKSARRAGVAASIAIPYRNLKKEIADTEIALPPEGYRALAPLNPLHAQILRLNAAFLQAAGTPRLTVWNAGRYDLLTPTAVPPGRNAPAAKLTFDMMGNEYRNEVLNFTNASSEELDVNLFWENLPQTIPSSDFTLFQVDYIGIWTGEMMPDVLTPLPRHGNMYALKIPSGMTRQLWIGCNSRNIPRGDYRFSLKLLPAQSPAMEVPVTLKIYPITFPNRPHLALGMWDYTAKPYYFQATTNTNVAYAVRDMEKHFVSIAWSWRIAWPESKDFNREGKLIVPLRTESLDEWITMHGKDKDYFMVIGRINDFAGEPLYTPRFEVMLKEWLTKLLEHLEKVGLRPRQLGFLLEDEPRNPAMFDYCEKFGKAVKKAAPDIRLFTDPLRVDNSPEMKAMLATHDVICLHLPDYSEQNKIETAIKIIHENANFPQTLHLYSAYKGVVADPYYYHRLEAWHAWKYGATGIGFWNYWNEYPDCWNQLKTKNPTFGVTYAETHSTVAGKHWEAIREGIEDYEYLYQLQWRVKELKATGKETALVREAEKMLQELPATVTETYNVNIADWKFDKNRERADQARIAILNMLEKLEAIK